jgi:diguanylate cyclase (GGDEF)-like protein
MVERVRAGARVVDRQLKLHSAHEQLTAEHERRSAALEALSATDELTGLHNRRGFITLAEQHFRVALRRQQPFAILFIDVNGLKAINDHLGHELGDQAIRETAAVLKRTMRDADITARLGGDEFVVLLDGCTQHSIDSVFARLKRELDSLYEDQSRLYRLSLSYGASFFEPARPRSIEQLLANADQRMYARKRERRTLSGPIVKGLPLSLHPSNRAGAVSFSPTSLSSVPVGSTGPEPSPQGGLAFGEHLRWAWNLRRADGGAHADRIVGYTSIFARALGGLQSEIPELTQLALMHDVGELALPDAIVHKRGPLDAMQFGLMKRHTVFGAELLSGVEHPFYERAARVARHHHERWNGSGYPDGLVGAECPFDARFVGIMDAYDSLRHPAHGSALSDEQLAEYFRQERGRSFEPELVDALINVLDDLRPAGREIIDG